MSAEFTTLRTPQRFNSAGAGKLPGHLGIVITEVSTSRVSGELPVVESVIAPNGYLHAGTIVTLADTVCGYGCVVNLPADASGFTTIELKSNHLGTTLDGTIAAVATPLHRGKTTQVWDAIVTHQESGRTLAVFRCTQMILYAKQKLAAGSP
jgi:1,4-dihydroxy-2-naphthoyl-CoA hydrolase